MTTPKERAQAIVYALLDAGDNDIAGIILQHINGAVDEERARGERALDHATDDDVLTDIVQNALVELGVKTRLDTGESMRGFCNSVAGQIITEMRLHFSAARGEHADD